MPTVSPASSIGATVISALARAIRDADPSATALSDGRARIHYGTLRSSLDVEMAWLHRTAGARHAVLADNSVAWALADLALHLGEVPSVPLPESFTGPQHLHALDDAGVEVLLTDDPDRARRLLPGWECDGTAPASGLTRFRRRLAPDARPVLPPGTRKVTYTSGSTSTPKGACLSGPALERVASSLVAATRDLSIERHLCLLPLATLLENVAGLYAPLLQGATCIIPSCRDTGMSYAGLDVARLLGAVGGHAPNSLILVPELLQVLVAAAERGWTVPHSLRFAAVGGARVSPALLARADAVGVPAYEGYGLSECASVVCLNTPGARRAGTVGRPLPHVRVRLDGSGQVHVAGNAMLGYLGDAERAPAGEIATGDLGAFDADGYLQLHGRAGNRFITSLGRNVSPEWIEAEVSQRLGGRPVLAFGEARPYVIALVGAAPADVDDATVARAVEDANAVLPSYAQVRRWARAPRPYTYVDGTLTANGRLRRATIHARCDATINQLYDEAIAS
jgi:long-subunit acyl-CoA synthetase (AMP-forming)